MEDEAPATLVEIVIPDPLLQFINACQTECVAECCGANAYSIEAVPLIDWGSSHGAEAIASALTQLESLLGYVDRYQGEIISSRDLNQIWNVGCECLDYFEVLRVESAHALATVGGHVWFNTLWITTSVRDLIAAIVAGRHFDRLPILADALEEVGCQNPVILNHCRRGRKHRHSCWVTDLLQFNCNGDGSP